MDSHIPFTEGVEQRRMQTIVEPPQNMDRVGRIDQGHSKIENDIELPEESCPMRVQSRRLGLEEGLREKEEFIEIKLDWLAALEKNELIKLSTRSQIFKAVKGVECRYPWPIISVSQYK